MSRLAGVATIQDLPDLNLQLRVTILAIVVADLRRSHSPKLPAWEEDFIEAADEFIRRGCPVVGPTLEK